MHGTQEFRLFRKHLTEQLSFIQAILALLAWKGCYIQLPKMLPLSYPFHTKPPGSWLTVVLGHSNILDPQQLASASLSSFSL